MNTLPQRLISPLLALSLATTAAAQGADDCANAQLIVGTGNFTYDTHPATSGGPQEAFWANPGLHDVHNDVWFQWVAPATGVYELSTCFPATQWAATFTAVYGHGCPSGPGRAIAARGGYDCGLFTTLPFGAEAGQTYLFRIGHSTAANHDNGTFSVQPVAPPAILGTAFNPVTGHTYHILEKSSWTVAQAAALLLGGNLATVNDHAENTWIDTNFSNFGGQPRSLWIGYNDAATEGVWEWASGETPTYTNWSVGGPSTPNNGNQNEHYAHFRRDWTDGTWNDLVGFPDVSYFYDEVHGIVEIDGAACMFINGTGVNPTGFDCQTLPVIGTTWTTTLPVTGNTVATYIGMSFQPGLVPLFGGELLLAPAPLPVLVSGFGIHPIALPNNPALQGTQLFAQGMRLDLIGSNLSIQLLNAQRATLGY